VTSELPPKLAPAPRIVKPRRRRYKALPVVAVAGDEVLAETGELITLSELVERLPDMPSTLFATMGAADLLATFDDVYHWSHPAAWQWRVSDYQRSMHTDGPTRLTRTNGRLSVRSCRVTIAVHFFGFKNHHYHKMIDPIVMHGTGLAKVWPSDKPEIVKVLQWATTLRDFCAANNLEVRPTPGGISSQLLTDPRFYPKARRKVPAPTNRLARDNLPGNYYYLAVSPSQERTYTAHQLDQHRAHHYHARTIHFPHADHLYAYGYFRNLTRYYREQPSPDFMGLYCLDLEAPPRGWAYSWLKRGILTHQFIYTNELSALLDMGYRVLGVRAAWGSHHRDTGLNKLATWACEQLDAYGDPRWLKMLLLSAYGTLGTRPTNGEAVFRLVKRGDEKLMMTGRRSLTGKMVRRPMKLEPGIANVIQLGMIQAGTRIESVTFARYLAHHGQRILKIHADAVFVEVNEDRPLPLLLDPWRMKRTNTHLLIESMQAYTSDQETKRPGGTPLRSRRMVAVTPGGFRTLTRGTTGPTTQNGSRQHR